MRRTVLLLSLATLAFAPAPLPRRTPPDPLLGHRCVLYGVLRDDDCYQVEFRSGGVFVIFVKVEERTDTTVRVRLAEVEGTWGRESATRLKLSWGRVSVSVPTTSLVPIR